MRPLEPGEFAFIQVSFAEHDRISRIGSQTPGSKTVRTIGAGKKCSKGDGSDRRSVNSCHGWTIFANKRSDNAQRSVSS